MAKHAAKHIRFERKTSQFEMMIEEISKIKMKIDAESRKAKIIQQAIEINKQSLENMNIQIGIYSENPYIQKIQVKIFCRNIREKVQ